MNVSVTSNKAKDASIPYIQHASTNSSQLKSKSMYQDKTLSYSSDQLGSNQSASVLNTESLVHSIAPDLRSFIHTTPIGIGDRVLVGPTKLKGTVAFVGPTHFAEDNMAGELIASIHSSDNSHPSCNLSFQRAPSLVPMS